MVISGESSKNMEFFSSVRRNGALTPKMKANLYLEGSRVAAFYEKKIHRDRTVTKY